MAIGEFRERARSPEPNGVVMTKIVSALGLMVALSLGAIAWMGTDVTAHAGVVGACAAGQNALDDGYGVSLKADCAKR